MNLRDSLKKMVSMFLLLSVVFFVIVFKNANNSNSIYLAVNDSITKITLGQSVLNIKVDQSSRISASTVPANMNNNLLWISNNKSVVSVDNSGLVTGIKNGTAFIIVVSKDNFSVRASCQVNVSGGNQNSNSTGNSSSNNNSSSTTSNNTTNNNTISNNNTGNSNTSSNQSNSTTTSNENKVTTASFLKSLEKMSKTAQKDYKRGKKWKYSNSNTSRSFDKAVNNGNRKTNCARYVSWALIDIGVLKSGEGFYKRSKNAIKYYGSDDVDDKMKNAFTYINGNAKSVSKLVSQGKLKAGDIVLWYSHQHTNVYAGNKKWYDAGRWSANKGSTGFTTFGPVKISSLNSSWKVWKILRLK